MLTTKASLRTRRANRTELRQSQSRILSQAKGHTIVEVGARGKGQEKYILDKSYFEELVAGRDAAVETLAILMDRKLFPRLLKAAGILEHDLRAGRLATLEEVFGEG